MKKLLIILAVVLLPSLCFGWTVNSTFEGGTNGLKAEGGNGFYYAGNQTTFSDAVVHSGDMAAKVHWGAGDEGWGEQHGEYSGLGALPTNEVWYRAYHYFPAGFDFTAADVSKFMRLRAADGYNSVFFNTDEFGATQLVLSIESSGGPAPGFVTPSLTRGAWHAVEIYVKFGDPGVVRIWLDGVLGIEETTRNTGEWIGTALFMTNWNGFSPATQDHYVDDVVITSDFATLTPQLDAAGNQMIGLSAPYFQDGFETGDMTHTENGAGWLSSSGNVTVTADSARTGTRGLKLVYPATGVDGDGLGIDSTAEQRFTLGSNKQDTYLRYYIKFPSNYIIRNTPDSNTKFFELWGEEENYNTDTQMSGGEAWNNLGSRALLGPTAYLNEAQTAFSYAAGSLYNHVWWHGFLNPWELTDADLDRWLCFEWHVKKDTGAGDGALEFFVDGVRKWGSTSLSYEGAPTAQYFKTGYLMGWSNPGFAETTPIFIDDVVMSDSYIGPSGPIPDTTPPVTTASVPTDHAMLVTLAANEPATIYYTTNGSAPTTGSSVYSAPINITVTTTLRFFARDTAGNSEVPQTVIYTVLPPSDTTAPVTTASAPTGSAQSVILSTNETATVYYTTDGSVPSTQSAAYASPIQISATTTLNFFAVDPAGNVEGMRTQLYLIVPPPPVPVGVGKASASFRAAFQ